MATVMVSSTRQALHLRVDAHGVVASCNDAAMSRLEDLGCAVGREAPAALLNLTNQARIDGVVGGRVPCGHGQLDVVVARCGVEYDVYGQDHQVDPDPLNITWDNPNPVLRVSREGRLLYANPAAEPLLRSWDVRTGGHLPEAWVSALRQVSPGDRRELVAGGGFAVSVCPQVNSPTVHLYGRKLG